MATTLFSPNKKYDVFISFRGEDTRKNFTSHLFKALCEKSSIKAYIDYLEIERGSEISQELTNAIEDSNLSLIVFSENYASSRWCLDELVKILECKRNQGQVVVPVFYKIDPSKIRKHCSLINGDNRVHKWRDALCEAANLAGWDSRNFRDESELIKEIVNDVLQKLNLKYPSEFRGLVGIDGNCKYIELLLEKAPIIGIWGMGGIGKTTIAKVVFAKLISQYQSHCFLENIREESKRHGLNYLHDKLMFELIDNNKVVGSTFLKRRLLSKKVLIVLDDVSNFEELENLGREFDTLGEGSRVIITTRDKHLLLLGRVNEIYEVKGLNFEDSIKLLCLNVFRDYNNSNPQMEYNKELLERAVVYTKGNPLALKVLGSLFHSKSLEICESALNKLKKYPNLQIQNVLKLSYDGLDEAEKEVFLDIAFFFVGEDKDHVIKILDDCDFYAASGVETLEDKALVTISKDNKIEMHDLIQEMGWEIVRQESVKDPGRRSRLRDTEEVCDVLKNNSGTDAVEGIIIDVSRIRELKLSADIFKKMINIRLLKFYAPMNERSCNVHLPTGLESFSPKLRYLQWSGYPLMSLPSSFCAEKLVQLRMPHSHVKKLWDGVQNFVSLKEIDLMASMQLMELPDLSKASKLEIVNVSLCPSLCHVHPSILSLNTLIDLVLYGCTNLKTLHLKSVKYLVVNGCFHLKEFSLASGELNMLDLRGTAIKTLDKSIARLEKLEKFYVCQSLKKVPSDLPSLTCLRELNLHNCKKLDTSNLCFLLGASHYVQKLSLDGCCNLVQVPNNIKNLSCLEYLSLRDCIRLRFLPKLPSQVTHLDAVNCTLLEKVLPSRLIGSKDITISFENCAKLDDDSRTGIVEHAHLTMKNVAYANFDDANVPKSMRKSGTFCLPGSRVPTIMFKNRTKHDLITIELPSPSQLFGFIFCIVLSPFRSNGAYEYHRIVCRWCLEDDDRRVGFGYASKWYHKGITELNSDHVYLWYEPSCDEIIEVAKESEANQKCTKGNNNSNLRVSFEFYVETYKLNEPKQIGFVGIKECGVCPIYASEYYSFMNNIELDQPLEHSMMGIGSYNEMEDEEEKAQKQQNQTKDTCHCLIGILLNHLWKLCQHLVHCQSSNNDDE